LENLVKNVKLGLDSFISKTFTKKIKEFYLPSESESVFLVAFFFAVGFSSSESKKSISKNYLSDTTYQILLWRVFV